MADKLLPEGGEVAVLEGLPSSTPAVERLNGLGGGQGQSENPGRRRAGSRLAAGQGPDRLRRDAAGSSRHQSGLRQQRHDGGRSAARRESRRQEGRRYRDHGTHGLPGPSGGIRAVARGEWAATFTYPTRGPQAIDMAKSILLDCAESVPTTVMVPTTAITPDNAKSMGNLGRIRSGPGRAGGHAQKGLRSPGLRPKPI